MYATIDNYTITSESAQISVSGFQNTQDAS